ncbi:hypothetical protein BD770DRAFT_395848 [Pilaira anomala]|nr:hypothetical protein BD770DRAFT_395848 [Pilaira anomala]
MKGRVHSKIPELPLEVLMLTFGFLETEDLVQCQLTNKEWYEASVELLYSKVFVYHRLALEKYVRTISSSARLGSHLKSLYTEYVFLTFGMTNEKLNDHELLEVIIRQCPNILELSHWKEDVSCWEQITQAVIQGRLSHLQRLPSPTSKTLEHYLCVALLLKKTLAWLAAVDDFFDYGSDLKYSKFYQKLLDQVKEFKNMKCFDLVYESNKLLSDFDTLIEDCPNLERLSLTFCPSKEERRILSEPKKAIVIPRPDICELRCEWWIIESENQIRYLMQKFPKLRWLYVMFGEFGRRTGVTRCPLNVLLEFLHYVIAIPKFFVEVEVRRHDLANIWNNLIDADDRFKDVAIDYFTNFQSRDINNLKLTTKLSTIHFALNIRDIESPQIMFFSEVGSRIRSLRIENLSWLHSSSAVHRKLSKRLDWIFHILQLCPSVQELSMYGNIYKIPATNDGVPQHTEVKKVTVFNVNLPTKSVAFLEYLSFKLPNMNQLYLTCDSDRNEFPKPVKINMPNTSLDVLTWRDVPSNYLIESELEVYIKLKTTSTGIKFYLGNKACLSEIDQQQYERRTFQIGEEENNNNEEENDNDDDDDNFSLGHVGFEWGYCSRFCMDITCKSLKELVIIEGRSSQSPEVKWVF